MCGSIAYIHKIGRESEEEGEGEGEGSVKGETGGSKGV